MKLMVVAVKSSCETFTTAMNSIPPKTSSHVNLVNPYILHAAEDALSCT